jgi:hypothetical protein
VGENMGMCNVHVQHGISRFTGFRVSSVSLFA